jgi:hypothetical protein
MINLSGACTTATMASGGAQGRGGGGGKKKKKMMTSPNFIGGTKDDEDEARSFTKPARHETWRNGAWKLAEARRRRGAPSP